MTLRTVGVKLTADISQYVSNMKRASTETRGFLGDLGKANREHKLDDLTAGAAGLGAGLAGVAGAAIKMAMDFDKQMSSVQAATHASGQEMDSLRQAALKAGADTKYSATEASKGIEELAKAGVSTGDILSGGLNGALSLAAAGEIEVGEAAETAASAMTQFKLQGKDLPHVADLLAAAAGKAQGSVHDMGQALNQAGLVASQTGLSIEDTTGTLAAFASAGLIGSDAGTSFKQMLLMLQAPSAKTKELMTDLGISAYDAQGQFVGITNLAQQLKDKLGVLTPELRANALAQIFGADATRAASILYEQGATGIQTWIDKTNDSGYAAETAAIKTDNLAGDVERLTGSLETMAISAGSGPSGGLRTLVQGADSLVNSLSAIPGPVQSAAVGIAGVTGAALLAAAGVGKMKQASAGAMQNLADMGPRGEKAAKGLGKVADGAGKATIALAALQVGSAAFGENLNPKIEALSGGLTKFSTTGQVAGETARLFGDDMGKLDTALKDVADTGAWSSFAQGSAGMIEGVTGLGNVVDESLTKSRERLESLDGALQAMVQQGNAQGAADVFAKIAERAKEQGVSVDELKKVLPGYAAALETAGNATATTDTKTQSLNGSLEQTEAAAKKAAEAFDDLFQQYMSADEAAVKYEESLVSTTKALKEGKKTLDLNTEAGRGNYTAILDRIKAINTSRDATIDEGGSIEEANGTYTKRLTTLRKDLLQMGYNATQVDALTSKYLAIPTKIASNVTTPGLPAADKAIKEYDKKIDAVAREIKSRVDVVGDATAYGKLKNLLIQQEALAKGVSVSAAKSAYNKQEAKVFHAGGWTGPGAKYDPAGTVHADEFVIKKESRQRLESRHPGLLDELNATGQLTGYAAGGRVINAPFPVNASITKIMTLAEALSKVTPSFGNWPSSPAAQRGDSGIWRQVAALIRSTGPLSGSFGNGYRPGDPKWHGSGRAVDWMGFNQDALASFLAAKRPLELIHRTKKRDYAYTRGVNKGSFNEALMNAHRNHVHIAMANGGIIGEPIVGVGASGNSYSFGEYGPEKVTPGAGGWSSQSAGSSGGVTIVNHWTINVPATVNKADVGREVVGAIQAYERGSGPSWRK